MSAFDTCTLDTCPIEASIFDYRPSLAANAAFIALFGISMVVQIAEGVRWKTKAFTSCMVCGCITEMIGYGGRVIMYNDPFEFSGFIMQIVCITVAPVFFSASIYLTLHDTIVNLSPGLARFKPKFYYILFIVCDVISLIFQSVGGGMSSSSEGGSQTGVNIALFGLSFQVFTLSVWIALSIDYALRYKNDVSRGNAGRIADGRFKVFVAFLSLATLCIFTRCVFRIAELSEGYSGTLLKQEGLFIGLEGVLVVVATFALAIGHPGLVFRSGRSKAAAPRKESGSNSSSASDLEKTAGGA